MDNLVAFVGALSVITVFASLVPVYRELTAKKRVMRLADEALTSSIELGKNLELFLEEHG